MTSRPATLKSPAFQFYPHDFLAGRVATYSMEEVGAYITLLAFDWTLGGLPVDGVDRDEIGGTLPKLSRNSLQTFAKLCRTSVRKFERIWAVIGDQFTTCDDGKLHNPRLQAERQKQLAYSLSMSENGRRGGRPRKPDESRGLAAVKPHESSPSPTPSTTKRKASPSAAPTWAARLAVVWGEEVGPVQPGRIGAALKEAVHRHGEERVERAMRAYIAMQKADGKPCNVKWFSDQVEVWVSRTATPVGVIDGEMSPTLELLTRPARAS